MIDYSEQDSPILSKDTSGDFSIVFEDEDFYFIAVGDVGGHGNKNVYSIAQKVKKLIHSNCKKPLSSILYFIHNQSDFKNNGIVLFLAKIFKNTPIIEYVNVGNIKAYIITKSTIKDLLIQDGIVAYTIPSEIQTNITKLNFDDKLIITTDGIGNSIDFNYIKTLTKAQQISSHIIKKNALPNDDSLCLSLIYKKHSETLVPYINNKKKIPQYKQISPKAIKLKALKPHKTVINKSYLMKLDKKYHLTTINHNDIKYKEKLYEIFSFCGLDIAKTKQLTTLLYEIRGKFGTEIDIYLNHHLLQMHFTIEDNFLESISLFFDDYAFKDKNFGANIILNNFIYDQQNIESFQELLYFSLDKESMKMNKQLQIEVDKKMTQLLQSQNMQHELSQKAYFDKLTGIYNRHKFEEIFKYEFKHYQRYDLAFSIALLDIDHFKRFNDTYGHQVGDEVLKMLSEHILKRIRQTDKFARWGGEEFVILFSSTTLEHAKYALEELRKSIETIKHPSAGSITASFGLSEIKKEDDLISFLSRCDEALYQAKKNGRNRIELKKD